MGKRFKIMGFIGLAVAVLATFVYRDMASPYHIIMWLPMVFGWMAFWRLIFKKDEVNGNGEETEETYY